MSTFYVINLAHRTDRKQHILNSFGKFKEINLVFVEATWFPSDGNQGCFLSHKKCIQLAKEAGHKNIVVIEDDCVPGNDFIARFLKIKEYLDGKDDWDIFLGGGQKDAGNNCKILKKIQLDNFYLLELESLLSTFFMIYNSSSYDFFLGTDENKIIDRCWHYKLRALISVPYLAYHLEKNHSDIRGQVMKYTGIKQTEKLLMKTIGL
jgi:hypothetical protein